ncbi:MAG: hypothetical protein QM757_01225 [Paludibaculum sp.]
MPRAFTEKIWSYCSSRRLRHGLEVGDPGVVDEDVDGAKGGFGGVEEAADVGHFGDVGLHSEAADLSRESFGLGSGAGVVDDDPGAFGGEAGGDGVPDTARGAGDRWRSSRSIAVRTCKQDSARTRGPGAACYWS